MTMPALAHNYLAAIHAAKNTAQLTDDAYRSVLHEVAGVRSAKLLDVAAARRVLARLAEVSDANYRGWSPGQLQIFRRYAAAAGLSDAAARLLVYQVTGVRSGADETLTQTDYDQTMAEVEKRCVAAGRLPNRAVAGYWQSKNPPGRANCRQIRKIWALWQELRVYLPEDHRNDGYLRGFVGRAVRDQESLADLEEAAAKKAIEALKQRLEQEKSQFATEIPF